jgi:transcriptional antiterminator RfaH
MPWYVTITKPRAERRVAQRLQLLDIEVFCPVRLERRQWSDRVKMVEVPLLPSMVLVHIEDAQRSKVFEAPGVLRYLFYLGQPAKVRNEEVGLLRDIHKNGSPIVAVKSIQPGDFIEVPGFGKVPQKGRVKYTSGNQCWVVLEQLGFVVTLQM